MTRDGGQPIGQQLRALERGTLDLEGVRMVVLDEADVMRSD